MHVHAWHMQLRLSTERTVELLLSLGAYPAYDTFDLYAPACQRRQQKDGAMV